MSRYISKRGLVVRLVTVGLLLAIPSLNRVIGSPAVQASEQAADHDQPAAKRFDLITLRGRVVWLAEAMARRHGLKSVPEAAERVLALETVEGALVPLAEDIRGRGFRRDARLRKMDLELLVRRYRGTPVVQVIRVFELTADTKTEVDYWCDICAIAMYELKPCDCCQGEIELRRRKVDSTGETAR